jgi:hypothetical protein
MGIISLHYLEGLRNIFRPRRDPGERLPKWSLARALPLGTFPLLLALSLRPKCSQQGQDIAFQTHAKQEVKLSFYILVFKFYLRWYQSVQNLNQSRTFCLLVCCLKPIILPKVLYMHKIVVWHYGKDRRRVFENRVLWRISGWKFLMVKDIILTYFN